MKDNKNEEEELIGIEQVREKLMFLYTLRKGYFNDKGVAMKFLMFDRDGVKFFFPVRSLFLEYLSCLVPEKVSKREVKKFLLGLDKEEGMYITIIWSDGSIREDSAFDYYKDLLRFLDKEGRLYD